jgi:hypothetical protein
MNLRLVGFVALLVAAGAGIVWFRAPRPAEPEPPAYLEVRLAQVEELAPALQVADPTGSVWARHFSENLPARTARECGAERFEAESASDFHQSVRIPASIATPLFLDCMRSKGGGYLRFPASQRPAEQAAR